MSTKHLSMNEIKYVEYKKEFLAGVQCCKMKTCVSFIVKVEKIL